MSSITRPFEGVLPNLERLATDSESEFIRNQLGLSQAKKNRSAYDAYLKAMADVKKYGNLPIPLKIRNPVTKLMKELDYGRGYEKYTREDLLPEKLKNKKYL